MRKGNKKKYMNGVFTYFSHDLISLDLIAPDVFFLIFKLFLSL